MSVRFEIDKDLRRRRLILFGTARRLVQDEHGQSFMTDRQVKFNITEGPMPDGSLPLKDEDMTLVEPYEGGYLQPLMDALWEAGMRPKGFVEEMQDKSNVPALKAHLADMRAIAFHKLSMEAPDEKPRALNLENAR